MSFSEVSNILWKERQLLELLLFKLEEEQLVLASGRGRWLTHATHEVEMVLEQVRVAELNRSIAVDELAGELGLESNPSLRMLSQASPDPWTGIFDEHRKAFAGVAQEIQNTATSNKDLLAQGYAATRDALTWLAETAGTDEPGDYSPTGHANLRDSGRTGLLNRTL